ncbi:IS110 family transposase [Hymenobacter artigasi]|uniref:Transposase n=1 Tax=Hymenobacter artigasi TaxID=2719616 RepID=A0ABX1HPA1_9BACT|nr:IS110 family transposase [Hymenobacter artigasi]NKI92083.1 transposase [Hymenobacter artigasi]
MDYIGIDISQAYVDADLPGGVQRLEQTADGHAALLAALPAGAVCVLEATGPYGLRLLAALHQARQPVCVVNPLSVRRFAQSQLRRSKTDRTDARLLSQFGGVFAPALHQPPAVWLSQLQQRQALLDLLLGQRTALRNHGHALRQSPWPDPVSTQALEAELTRLDKQVADLEKSLEQDARAQCGADYERLQTIPGVGPRIALALLLAGPGLRAFPGWRQAVAYAGLCPRHYESGSSVRGRPRLSKLGDGRLRRLLYVGAWSAKTKNPACAALYQRLVARGLAGKQALCAVAARLLRQAWAVVANECAFDPNHHLLIAS